MPWELVIGLGRMHAYVALFYLLPEVWISPIFFLFLQDLEHLLNLELPLTKCWFSIGSQARLFLYVFYHFAFHFYPSKAVDW